MEHRGRSNVHRAAGAPMGPHTADTLVSVCVGLCVFTGVTLSQIVASVAAEST